MDSLRTMGKLKHVFVTFDIHIIAQEQGQCWLLGELMHDSARRRYNANVKRRTVVSSSSHLSLSSSSTLPALNRSRRSILRQEPGEYERRSVACGYSIIATVVTFKGCEHNSFLFWSVPTLCERNKQWTGAYRFASTSASLTDTC